MKIIHLIIFILCIFCCANTWAQKQFQTRTSVTNSLNGPCNVAGGSVNDIAYNGTYYFTVGSDVDFCIGPPPPTTYHYGFIQATDRNGATSWQKAIVQDPNGVSFNAVTIGNNNDVIVAGTIGASASSKFMLIDVDNAGNVLGAPQNFHTYTLTNNNVSGANAVIPTFNSGVQDGYLAVGFNAGIPFGVKVNQNLNFSGSATWSKTFIGNGSSTGAAVSVVETPDNNHFAILINSGGSGSSNPGIEVIVISYDGTTVTSKNSFISTTAGTTLQGSKIQNVSGSGGGFIITGSITNSSGSTPVLINLSATLGLNWAKSMPSSILKMSSVIQNGNNSDFVVCGTEGSNPFMAIISASSSYASSSTHITYTPNSGSGYSSTGNFNGLLQTEDQGYVFAGVNNYYGLVNSNENYLVKTWNSGSSYCHFSTGSQLSLTSISSNIGTNPNLIYTISSGSVINNRTTTPQVENVAATTCYNCTPAPGPFPINLSGSAVDTINASTIVLCANDDLLLQTTTVPGLTYFWYVDKQDGNGDQIMSPSPSINQCYITGNHSSYPNSYYQPPGTVYKYSLQNCMYGSSACASTAAPVYFTVKTLPSTVSINASPNLCMSTSGIVTLSSGFTDPNLHYVWTQVGSSATYADLPTLTLHASNISGISGQFNVKIYYTSGCSVTSANVTVANDSTPVVTGVYCASTAAVQTASISGYTYHWYRNGSNIPNTNSSLLPITLSGSYYVRVTNSYGCDLTSTALALPQITGPTCFNNNVSPSTQTPLSISSTIGNAFTVAWYNSKDTFLSSNPTYVPTYAPAIDTNDYAMLNFGAGCSIKTDVYHVNIIPQINIKDTSGNTNSCLSYGSTTTQTLHVDGGSGNYAWYFIPKNSIIPTLINSSASTISASAPGQYYATVTANGCSGPSSSYVITQPDQPIITCLSGSSCSLVVNHNSTAILNATSATGYTLQWYKNGSSYGTGSSITIDDIASYSVQLVDNASGCISQSSYFNVTDPNFSPDVQVETPQCSDTSKTLSVLEIVGYTTIGTGYGPGGNNYPLNEIYTPKQVTWHWGDLSSPSIYTNVNSSTARTHTYSNDGTYTVYADIVDAGGCTHTSTSYPVTFNTNTPTITLTDGGINCSASTSKNDWYKRHTIHVHATGVDTIGNINYEIAEITWSDPSAIFQTVPGSATFNAGTLDYDVYVNASFYGYLNATIVNSGCHSATSPASVHVDKPSAAPISTYAFGGTYSVVKGEHFNLLSGIDLGMISPCSYSFAPVAGSGTLPIGLFNTSTYDFNSAYGRDSSSYSFDMTIGACTTSSPQIACSATGYTQNIAIFEPTVTTSYTPNPFCGTNNVTLTVTISNIPLDYGFTPYLYDASGNLIDPSPAYYYNGLTSGSSIGPLKQFALTYNVPTIVGNTVLDLKLKISHQYFPISDYMYDAGNITLTSATSHSVALNYSIGGGSSSAVTSTPIVVCPNDPTSYPLITSSVTGIMSGHPYTYVWYDRSNLSVPLTSPITVSSSAITSATGALNTGLFPSVVNYQLQVTDLSGCTINANISLTDSPGVITEPAPTASASYFCLGSSFTLSASTAPNYQWQELVNGQWTTNFSYINTGTSSTGPNMSIDHAGTYRYYVSPPTGCLHFSDPITVIGTNNGLSIQDISGTYTIASASLNVTTALPYSYSGPYNYYLKGSSTSLSSGSSSWSPATHLPALSSGYYYLTAQDSCGNTITSNFVYLSTGSCPSCSGTSPTTTCLSNSIPTPQTGVSGSLINTSSDFNVSTIGLPVQIGDPSASRTTLTMGNCKTIFVAPNCTLTIKNTDIVGCSPWGGIVVLSDATGKGTLIMDNCTISDANMGVVSVDGATVQITNCTFSNNGTHIALLPHTGTHNAIIQNNMFKDAIYVKNTCNPFYSIKNATVPKMLYIQNIQGMRNDISGNTFTGKASNMNGVEIYGSNTIAFSNNTFNGSMNNGIYAIGNNGANVYGLAFRGNLFDGSSSSGTFKTGIYLDNVGTCSIDGAGGSTHNEFKYLANGIEYYHDVPFGGSNYIQSNKFDHNTYGIVGAPSVYPINSFSGSNTSSIDLGIAIGCNDFFYNRIGILGSGKLSDQGNSGTDAGNNFNNTNVGSHSCPGCTSLDTCADILWVGNSSSPSNYYTSSAYDPTLISGGISSACAVTINGSSTTSTSNVSIGGSSNMGLRASSLNTCWGAFKNISNVGYVITEKTSILVYPNPTNASFTLEIKNGQSDNKYKIIIIDALGRRIMQNSSNLQKQEINAEAWNAGIYYLTVIDDSGHIFSTKLVKVN